MAALTLCMATWRGMTSQGLIYLIAAVAGSARAFESPSMSALLPNLIPRAQLQYATAWSTSANQTAQILGPAMGGLLYGLGALTVYGAVAVAFIGAAVVLSSIKTGQAVRMRTPPAEMSMICPNGWPARRLPSQRSTAKPCCSRSARRCLRRSAAALAFS